jgi:hypothetical protein
MVEVTGVFVSDQAFLTATQSSSEKPKNQQEDKNTMGKPGVFRMIGVQRRTSNTSFLEKSLSKKFRSSLF